MIIVRRLDISFHRNLLSASKHFRFGVEYNCLLSLIEGLSNFVANPNAEISPDAGNDNIEKGRVFKVVSAFSILSFPASGLISAFGFAAVPQTFDE